MAKSHILLLTTFAILLAGQAFAQSPPSPPIGQKDQTQSQQQKTAPDQRGTEQQPLIVQPLATKKTAEITAHEAQEAREKSDADWWTKTLGILTIIALFGQLAVFIAQAYFLKSTLEATKVAAEAASAAVNAVPIVERAYVYPVVIGHGTIEECIKNALVYYLDDFTKNDVPVPETTEITFKFKNFGKTPAVLKSAFVAFGVPPHGALIGVAIPESVLASLENTSELISQMQVGFTREQAKQILVYTEHVSFEGVVTFDDIWGNEHTTRFYFVWDKEIKRMALRGVETKTKQKSE
jgi:hypothetical protein